MRLASFLVTAGRQRRLFGGGLSGQGGDDLANLNRWRRQVNLAPVSEQDLPNQFQPLAGPAGRFVVSDLRTAPGQGPTRILGAWLRVPDRVWFFKLMGPAAGGRIAKGRLFPVLGIDPVGGGRGGRGRCPAASGPMAPGMGAIPVQAEAGAALLWEAPAGWQNAPGRRHRAREALLRGRRRGGDHGIPGRRRGSPGQRQSLAGQAGLGPVDDAGLGSATTALDSHGLHLLVMDASEGSSPIVAALVPWNGGTWFFKLTGPSAAVAEAKPAFLAFLHTVRAP